MAISSSSSSIAQILSPLHLNINTNKASSSSNLPFIKTSLKSTTKVEQRSSIILFSAKPKNEMANQQKRELLESYGLDPNKYLSQPSTKTKRRRGAEKSAIDEQGLIDAPKPPRTTHKLLQVLGGKARRMKLLSPKGMNVRPMMEVVKGAAFDILQVAGGCPASLRAGRWLDLYSGTGSVGIEAISRGCSEAHFVEMDPWVISNVLKPNLEWTGFVDDSVIHAVRVEIFFERAEKLLGNFEPFDYISVTPPYMEVDYAVLMGQISKSALVGENTFIVVEYPLGTDMLDTCGCLVKIADRRFGRTILAIYGPLWAQKKKMPKKRSIKIVLEEK